MTHSIEPLTARAVARLALDLERYDSGRTSTDVLRRISLDVIDCLRLSFDQERRVFEDDDTQTAFCSLLRQYGLRDEVVGIDVASQAGVVPISDLRPDFHWIQRYIL